MRREVPACVITIDLRGSRKMRNRAAVQVRVFRVLRLLRHRFSNDLLTGFRLTGGDEFQGVLRKPDKVMDVFKLVRRFLGVDFYCGVGIGGIATPIRERSVEMDGSAFHRSKEAMSRAKRERTELVIVTQNKGIERDMNTVIQLILHTSHRWTAKQREVIAFLEDHPNATQTEAARHFRVSKQAISNTLSRAGWDQVRKGYALLEIWLERLGVRQSRGVYFAESIRRR